MKTREIWKPIEGYKDYEVSNLGRIRRVTKACGTWPGRIIGGGKLHNGYPTVQLWKDRVGTQIKMHILVIRAFRGMPKQGYETRHLDGNRLNNKLSNLKYGTRKQNVADAIMHGTHKNPPHFTGNKHWMRRRKCETKKPSVR